MDRLTKLLILFILNIPSLHGQIVFPTNQKSPIWNISSTRFLDVLDDHSYLSTKPDTSLCGISWTPIKEYMLNEELITDLGFYRVDSSAQKVFYKSSTKCDENDIFLLYDFSVKVGDIFKVKSLVPNQDSSIYTIWNIDTIEFFGVSRRVIDVSIVFFDIEHLSNYEVLDQWIEGIGSIYHPFGIADFFYKKMLPLESKILRCHQQNKEISYSNPKHPFCFSPDRNIIFVDSSNTNLIQDGKTWQTAFSDLNLALENTSALDSIWVAKGTYYPSSLNNRIKSFNIKSGVKIFGGFKNNILNFKNRDVKKNATILSGDIGILGDSMDNSFHVVKLNLEDEKVAIIDGFYIQKGTAIIENSSSPNFSKGGGILIEASENLSLNGPFIKNCHFSNNSGRLGGAICISKTKNTSISPVITNCEFLNNTAVENGGAIYYETGISNKNKIEFHAHENTFESNHSTRGGAIYILKESDLNLTIDSSDFFNNNSIIDGGGITIRNELGSLNCKIIKSNFHDNSGKSGAAFSLLTFALSNFDTLNLSIESSIFLGNLADTEGGAIAWFAQNNYSNVNIKKSLFQKNQAFWEGGAIYLTEDVNGKFNVEIDQVKFYYNSTFTGYNGGLFFKTEFDKAVDSDLLILNSVFARNTGAIGINSSLSSRFTGNIINCTFSENGKFPLLKTNGAYFTDSTRYCNINIYNSLLSELLTGTSPILGSGNFETPNLIGYTLKNNAFSKNFILDLPGQDLDFRNHNLLLDDPYFNSPNLLDWSLKPCSPAIDKGDVSWILGLNQNYDIEGKVRVIDENIDIGAYEQEKFEFTLLDKQNISCYGTDDGLVSFFTKGISGEMKIFWENNVKKNTSTIDDLGPGNYVFLLKDSIGCSDSIEVNLFEPDPISLDYRLHNSIENETNAGSIVIQDIQGGTPPFSFFWNTGDNTKDIEKLVPGNYQLEISDYNDCLYYFDFTISLITKIESLYKNSINVFPNPFSENIFIENSKISPIDILIISETGKIVYNQRNVEISSAIDLSFLERGVYFLLIFDKTEVALVEKMIKISSVRLRN